MGLRIFITVIIHWAITCSNSLSVLDYAELHGYYFNFRSLGTTRFKCPVHCVKRCSETEGCQAVNVERIGRAVVCDFQAYATENSSYLISNPASTFICKYNYSSLFF